MPAMIQCPICQKEYRWKPELAGKRVKCKCGEVIDVPEGSPSAEEGELYDLVDAPASKAASPMAELEGASSPARSSSLDSARDFPCPYCGEKVEGGSTMCVFCGSNLEGAIPPPSQRLVPTAAQAAPPTMATIQPRPAAAAEEVKKTRLLLVAAISLIVLFVIGINIRKFLPKRAAPDPNIKPQDITMVQRVNESGKDAREWLSGSDVHMLGTRWSKKQALNNVDEVYKLGAKRVIAFGAGISSTMAVELPDDATKRKAIFEWQAKLYKDTNINEQPTADDGQKWLEITAPS